MCVGILGVGIDGVVTGSDRVMTGPQKVQKVKSQAASTGVSTVETYVDLGHIMYIYCVIKESNVCNATEN